MCCEHNKKTISQHEVNELCEELDFLCEGVARFAPELTQEERNGLVSMKPGGDAIAAVVGAQAEKLNPRLPGMKPEEVGENLAVAQRLQSLATRVALLSRMVSDGIAVAQSRAWSIAMAYYQVLLAIGQSDGHVADALQPAVEFFSKPRGKNGKGRRAKAKAVEKAKLTLVPTLEKPETAAGAPAAPSGQPEPLTGTG